MRLHTGAASQSKGLLISGNRIGDEDDTAFQVGAQRFWSHDLDVLFEPDPAQAAYTFVVRAGGSGGSTAPRFDFLVDGELVGTRTITNPVSGTFNTNNDALYRDNAFAYSGPTPTEIDVRTPRRTRCGAAEASSGRSVPVFWAGDRSNGGRFRAAWAV